MTLTKKKKKRWFFFGGGWPENIIGPTTDIKANTNCSWPRKFPDLCEPPHIGCQIFQIEASYSFLQKKVIQNISVIKGGKKYSALLLVLFYFFHLKQKKGLFEEKYCATWVSCIHKLMWKNDSGSHVKVK